MIPIPRLALRGLVCLLPLLASTAVQAQLATPRQPGELAWTIAYDPKTFDPAKVDDQESEEVRFLTAGVLLRLNRQTQQVEPALAENWSVSPDGRTVTFKLRAGLRFSDDSPLGCERRRLFHPARAPARHCRTNGGRISRARRRDRADPRRTYRRGAPAEARDRHRQGLRRDRDRACRQAQRRTCDVRARSLMAEYRRSQYVRLRRNDRTIKAARRPARVQLRVCNRHSPGCSATIAEQERSGSFLRGEYDVINVPAAPDYFGLLKQKMRRTRRAILDLR